MKRPRLVEPCIPAGEQVAAELEHLGLEIGGIPGIRRICRFPGFPRVVERLQVGGEEVRHWRKKGGWRIGTVERLHGEQQQRVGEAGEVGGRYVALGGQRELQQRPGERATGGRVELGDVHNRGEEGVEGGQAESVEQRQSPEIQRRFFQRHLLRAFHLLRHQQPLLHRGKRRRTQHAQRAATTPAGERLQQQQRLQGGRYVALRVTPQIKRPQRLHGGIRGVRRGLQRGRGNNEPRYDRLRQRSRRAQPRYNVRL